jgi:hypothetical protein
MTLELPKRSFGARLEPKHVPYHWHHDGNVVLRNLLDNARRSP